MITASMTANEMRKVRNMDEYRINEFQMQKAEELKRELNRQKVKNMAKTYEFVTPNADYFVVVSVKQGGIFASGVFVYLKETNEYIPMTRNSPLHEDCFAMSVHFINRYAERHLNKKLPVTKVLQKFFMSFLGAVRLYFDEETKRIVFAVPEGLVLATYDLSKHIIHYKTFVSMDMLKKTQASSYEKISAFLRESCNRIAKARDTGDDNKLEITYKMVYKDAELLDTSEAKAIYSSFFEKGGEL